MINNINDSKKASTGGVHIDFKKFTGVASVNIVAINPDNAKLRKLGFDIPEDAPEQTYLFSSDKGNFARVRFMAQIQDIAEKPIIPLDFTIRKDYRLNGDGTKCQIIDQFGRTAWATKEETRSRSIPQYANGPAKISVPYKMCHSGEEEIVRFLMKYLNVTPLEIFSRTANAYVPTKDPGMLIIDHWDKLCEGDVSEIAGYIALKPKNCVKVILGVRLTDNNRTYQLFINSAFLSNNSFVNPSTGVYDLAKKHIDRYMENKDEDSYVFSARAVQPYVEEASVVEDNSGNMFEGASGDDDLPFD